jgi:hypothetical protein
LYQPFDGIEMKKELAPTTETLKVPPEEEGEELVDGNRHTI